MQAKLNGSPTVTIQVVAQRQGLHWAGRLQVPCLPQVASGAQPRGQELAVEAPGLHEPLAVSWHKKGRQQLAQKASATRSYLFANKGGGQAAQGALLLEDLCYGQGCMHSQTSQAAQPRNAIA